LKLNQHLHLQRVKGRPQCHLINDPHAFDFNRKYFDAQWDGEFVLYKGLHLEASYRTKRFGTFTSNIKWKVHLYGQIIESLAFDVHKIIINDNPVTLHEGVKNLRDGGFIKVAGTTITISTGDGESVDFVSGGWFFNSFVTSDAPHVSGLCSGQRVNSHDFAHPQQQRQGHEFKVKSCESEKYFEHQCKQKGLRGQFLKNCVFDLCSGISLRSETKIVRQQKRQERKVPPRPVPRNAPSAPRANNKKGKW